MILAQRYNLFLLLTGSNLDLVGGVPGGVFDGELLKDVSLLFNGGIQANQRLLGLSPKFSPSQLSYGLHDGESLPGGEGSCASGEGGGDEWVVGCCGEDLSIVSGSASSSLH